MGGEVHVLRTLARDLDDKGSVVAVSTHDGGFDSRVAELLHDRAHVIRTGSDVQEVRLHFLAFQLGDLRGIVLVPGLVVVFQDDLPALLDKALLEILAKEERVLHPLVDEEVHGLRLERVHRILGTGRRLHIVAEAGEIEVIRHLVGQLRRGRSRGDEDDTGLGRRRSGRHHHVTVAEAEHRHDFFSLRELGGRRADRRGIGLPVERDELDLLAQHTAGRVQLLGGEIRAIGRGSVQGCL